jgi:predicted O-methyltransferase YrrM
MTNDPTWTAVDDYFSKLLLPPDKALEQALADSVAAGLPAIAVSPLQGKQLLLLAQMQNPKRILEIGTLGGYSTIWLARALPADGRLITIEFDPKHAAVARRNLQRAGLGGVVELREGAASAVLPRIVAEKTGPFDLIFIDADKESNADYFQWAMKLSRLGSLIVIDNVVRKGEVVNAGSTDPSVQGVRRCNELLAAEKRVSATAIQTVGSKGYDGFALALVIAE